MTIRQHLPRLILAGALAGLAATAAAQAMRPTLTLDTARKMAVGCEERARKEGWTMSIAVVDAGGQLKYFSRADDTIGISIGLAQAKARTSASVPVSTRKFREIARGNALGLELTPGASTVAGGLPVMAQGMHIGGIGVSGASEDQDEVCAQAGLDAARDGLK
ncbi:MAG: GlcG/HbpS family heme-binding protein [Inhella sp.]|jgi:glc operon protein GlcG|uniref:GlcG/HbpS family heme-binding protein n=1 Tax=Inhella sp. TaxID=1921806 RepID=UPI0022C1E2F4|nr:heme-binding protein [Inhella sp.]MCZ8235361.1 heme-binding protein [Inhella sp.]